jgi:hypothetical protein
VEGVTGGGEAGVTPPVTLLWGGPLWGGPLWGGSDETDWACAAAATPANNPRLRAVDFSKLDIPETSFLRLEYVDTYARFPCMKAVIVHRTHE